MEAETAALEPDPGASPDAPATAPDVTPDAGNDRGNALGPESGGVVTNAPVPDGASPRASGTTPAREPDALPDAASDAAPTALAHYDVLPVQELAPDGQDERIPPPTPALDDERAAHVAALLAEKLLRYNPAASAERIKKAYMFAAKAHAGQARKTGEPYIIHPVQVAEILLDLHLDEDSIITGLLHDTVEDNPDITLEEIEREFGGDVAKIVDGVTKLTQVGRRGRRQDKVNQAENLQKFVLAMSKDVRVLFVKLADRLHNMRTLHHVPRKASRLRKAEETLDIYAPLARRMGVHRVCGELEDLAFQHMSPAAYHSVTKRLSEERAKRTKAVADVSSAVNIALAEAGVNARIFGREKRPHSIWRKLQRRGLDFEDLADVFAFRVIVPDLASCYQALGIIHQSWRCVPERFKDYISTPKPNGYQSLHTTVMGPDNRRVELQIRSEQMDRVAEDGFAAHWKYKNQSYGCDEQAGFAALERLRPLVEILNHGAGDEEFLENTKLEMFSDQVFTFTPRGRVIPLPVGATPVDFAYAVHTDLGDTCVGAKVNGRPRPLRTPLSNGDVVEIVRSKTPGPPPAGENGVVTGKARSAIRRLVRRSQRDEYARIGRAIAEHAFRREGLNLDDIKLDEALSRLECENETALYAAMGRGDVSGADLMEAVYPGQALDDEEERPRDLITDQHGGLYVVGADLTPGISLTFAPCCTPLPGERIVGVPAAGRGLDVHKIDCDVLAGLEDKIDTWVDLAWTAAVGEAVAGTRILATVQHERGALAEITSAVARSRGNIVGLRIVRRNTEFFDFSLDIEVESARHLSHILASMRACSTVVNAERTTTHEDKG